MGLSHSPSIVTNGIKLCLDASNPKSYSKNVHPNPTDAFVWANAGGAYQISMSRDTSIQSPVGPSPLKLVTSGTSGYLGTYNNSYFNLAPAVQGETWTFSFWVKGDSSFQASMMIFEATASGGYTNLSQIFYNVTPQWTRVSGSRTMTRSDTANVQVRIDCYVNGVTLWVDGLQVEKSDSASSFNPIPNLQASKIFDISNNGNTGALANSPTYSSANGGYITFDGLNEYVNIGVGKGVNQFSGDFTLSAWVMRLSGGPTYGNIFGDYYTNTVATTNEWQLLMGSSTPAFVLFRVGSGSFLIGTPSGYNLNIWYNVVISRIGSTITMYVNGNSIATATNSAVFGTATGNFNIGIDGNNSSEPFRGRIANVMIYNSKGLTAAEVQQNFNALRGRFGI